MSWTRTPLTALAVCVLLLTGTVGCGSGAARERGASGVPPSPVGRVLDDTDGDGRRHREADEGHARQVGIEVQPPAGAQPRAMARPVPRGTHHVTVQLHADDGTVWAVDGTPVESTADLTASGAETTVTPTSTTSAAALSEPGARPRIEGRGSPDRAGKAS
ncbi:hypothetical protein ABZ078_11600 [Streptomyces sp. NPDC006385]|uniref:hypothetical protein n=1 Tax=Streptomyces sp. NPDC006385 TaxID=3156761 RepID=UPI0033B4D56A